MENTALGREGERERGEGMQRRREGEKEGGRERKGRKAGIIGRSFEVQQGWE